MGNPETLVTLGTQDTGKRIEKTQGQINNGQSRDIGNFGYTGQRLEKTQGQIKNGQSRDTGNIGCTRHRTKKNKTKHTTYPYLTIHDPLHILKYQHYILNRHTHVHL
jgi:hypothetical protein